MMGHTNGVKLKMLVLYPIFLLIAVVILLPTRLDGLQLL